MTAARERGQCLCRAEGVQPLRRFAAIVVVQVRRDQPFHPSVQGLALCRHRAAAGRRCRRIDRRRPASGVIRRRSFVWFEYDLGEDEAVAMPRDGTDETRVARVVAKRDPQGPHRLRERAVGHDDVAPDAVEDLGAGNRVFAPFQEQQQKIEIARNQCNLGPVSRQRSASGRDDESGEAVADRRSHERGPGVATCSRKRAAGAGARSAPAGRLS